MLTAKLLTAKLFIFYFSPKNYFRLRHTAPKLITPFFLRLAIKSFSHKVYGIPKPLPTSPLKGEEGVFWRKFTKISPMNIGGRRVIAFCRDIFYVSLSALCWSDAYKSA